MADIKVYLDEDVHTFIAHALHLRSWEALTTQEAGRRSVTDLDQIALSERGYAILTYNIHDFPRLHTDILAGEKRLLASSWARDKTRVGTFMCCSTSYTCSLPKIWRTNLSI